LPRFERLSAIGFPLSSFSVFCFASMRSPPTARDGHESAANHPPCVENRVRLGKRLSLNHSIRTSRQSVVRHAPVIGCRLSAIGFQRSAFSLAVALCFATLQSAAAAPACNSLRVFSVLLSFVALQPRHVLSPVFVPTLPIQP
jgi:hypothetical protein